MVRLERVRLSCLTCPDVRMCHLEEFTQTSLLAPGCTTLSREGSARSLFAIVNRGIATLRKCTLCASLAMTRTLYLQDDWIKFLRVLWREQHPEGHEQVALNFAVAVPQPTNALLFAEWRACGADTAGTTPSVNHARRPVAQMK